MENEASKEEKKGRGGPRPGSGRKPHPGAPLSYTIALRLTPAAARNLARLSQERGLSRNETVLRWLEGLYPD